MTPESSNTAKIFGIAIRPFMKSARSHTTPIFIIEPTNTPMTHRIL